MTTHSLKVWPRFFAAIKSGEKTFEIRSKSDRVFAVGDLLELEEFEPCKKCDGDGWRYATKHTPFGAYQQTVKCPCMSTPHPKGRYTGQTLARRVTFILDSEFGLKEGFACMGLSEENVNDA